MDEPLVVMAGQPCRPPNPWYCQSLLPPLSSRQGLKHLKNLAPDDVNDQPNRNLDDKAQLPSPLST